MDEKYPQIIELAAYWQINLGGSGELSRAYDGYKYKFPSGADVIQHQYSYGCDEECVEFAGLPIEGLNYVAIPIEEAKELVETFFDELSETY
jgi:hypothetical protein